MLDKVTSVNESSIGHWMPTAAPIVQCKTLNHLFLFSLRYLVEQRDVDFNVRDKWDSTPL